MVINKNKNCPQDCGRKCPKLSMNKGKTPSSRQSPRLIDPCEKFKTEILMRCSKVPAVPLHIPSGLPIAPKEKVRKAAKVNKLEKYIGRTIPARSKIHLPNIVLPELGNIEKKQETEEIPAFSKIHQPNTALPELGNAEKKEEKKEIVLEKHTEVSNSSQPVLTIQTSDHPVIKELDVQESKFVVRRISDPTMPEPVTEIEPIKSDLRIQKLNDNKLNLDSGLPSCQRKTEDTVSTAEKIEDAPKMTEEDIFDKKQRLHDEFYLKRGFAYFDDLCTCSFRCILQQLIKDKFITSTLKSVAMFTVGLQLTREFKFWTTTPS